MSPALQQPQWPDRAALDAVRSRLEGLPPLVLAAECDQLRVNEPERYRVPLVGTAYRFRAGHRLRLILTSDDQDAKFPAMMTFRHASVGTSSLNRIASSSRLVLPTP